ncbi:MAG: hypothetical protein ACI9RM_002256 [Ulvibacter sp.]|jgi:hypothetical protein
MTSNNRKENDYKVLRLKCWFTVSYVYEVQI